MKIINPKSEDYHMHSIVFSDGFNTIDELVQTAGKIGLKKIAITDHCQAHLEAHGYVKRVSRESVAHWRNIHNDVEVTLGVEGDILNEQGDICEDIQGVTSDFLILSAHKSVYQGPPEKITQAYLNAMNRHADKIKFFAHPCSIYFEETLDIEKVIIAANEYKIPMELNCANLYANKTNLNSLRKMLGGCDQVVVNSDAHTLHQLVSLREEGFKFLREECFYQG